jgi:predicted transcriptional regulator
VLATRGIRLLDWPFDEHRFTGARMSETSPTFRIDAERRAARSADAAGSDRVREIVPGCPETDDWQARHIEEGLRQAEAGELASDEEVARALRRERG